MPAASASGLFSFPASKEAIQAGALLVTLELLSSLFVRSSRSAGSTALNQGTGFRPCVAFRSKEGERFVHPIPTLVDVMMDTPPIQ